MLRKTVSVLNVYLKEPKLFRIDVDNHIPFVGLHAENPLCDLNAPSVVRPPFLAAIETGAN